MDNHLSIVTYNIHHGTKVNIIVKNLSELVEQGVSIFCLQEVRKRDQSEFIVNSLLKTLGPQWQAEYLIKPDSFDLGLCTLWDSSRLSATGFDKLLLPKLKRFGSYEKVFLKAVSKIEKLAPSHYYLQPTQKAALVGNFKINGKSLRITNVHLDWQGGPKHRDMQLSHVYGHLLNSTGAASEILCGDFNSLGFYRFSNRRTKKITTLLGENFIDAFQNKRTTSYMQMLDHIFVKNLNVIKAKVLKYKGSDHYPLLAEIAI